MNNQITDEVRAIHASMEEAGRLSFLDSELVDLGVVIRLTVEFFHFLGGDYVPMEDEGERVRYVSDSIFSGIDSFALVGAAYRVLNGARQTTLATRVTSVGSLKEEFAARYREFLAETNFEERCRLLLDLFKLQIIFAGLSY